MSYFQNKTIWITGASAGIGKALALSFAEKGANLILSSRKKEALDKVSSECVGSGVKYVLPLDLENHEELDKLLSSNYNLISKVDILINNGGVSQRSKVEDTEFIVYKKLMDINYLGAVKLSLGVLPFFKKRNQGHYVVISSMAGKFGVPVRSGYSASKMALHGFFDALRAEQRNSKIKVTIICPGYIRTDISKNALTASGAPQGTMDDAQRSGMDVRVLADKILIAIEKQKEELHVGGFKETKFAGVISRLFPGIFKKIIAKSKVT